MKQIITSVAISLLGISVIILGVSLMRLSKDIDAKIDSVRVDTRYIFDNDDFKDNVLKTIKEDSQRKECEEKGGEFSLVDGEFSAAGRMFIGEKEPRCIIENNISDIYKNNK